MNELQQLQLPEGATEFGSAGFWLAALAIVMLCGLLLGFVDGRVQAVLRERKSETGQDVTWKTRAMMYLAYFIAGAAVGAPFGLWLWDSILLGLICGAIGGAGGTWIGRLGKGFIEKKFGGGK
jgi:hypothetical protein